MHADDGVFLFSAICCVLLSWILDFVACLADESVERGCEVLPDIVRGSTGHELQSRAMLQGSKVSLGLTQQFAGNLIRNEAGWTIEGISWD